VPSSALTSQLISKLNIPVLFTFISIGSEIFLHLIIMFSVFVTKFHEFVSSNLYQMLEINFTYFKVQELGKMFGFLNMDLSQDPST